MWVGKNRILESMLSIGEEVIRIGEQKVPDAIGKEVGVAADLRRGHPKPREISSQHVQYQTSDQPDENKDVKLEMSEKVRGED